MPKFSIIIPTHNRPNLLARAIGSVLNQKCPDWEIIVVDDGSVPSAETERPELFADERISYYWQEASGPGAARKRGLNISTAPWLCFLDDDDYYLPDHLSVLEAAVESLTDWRVLVATGMITQKPDGNMVRDPTFATTDRPLPEYWRRPVSLLPFAISRQLIVRVPVPMIPSPIEDFEWLCLLLSSSSLLQLPAYTVVYVEHEVNRTNTLIDPNNLDQRLAVISRLINHTVIRQQVPLFSINKMQTHQCWHHARQCLKAQEFKSAGDAFLRGFKTFTIYNLAELAYTVLCGLRALKIRRSPR
ncbi:glycosyltransferase family 2 protein [Neolewinella litorea]|uniref:Glycosyltransferase family 2 protein n=1 Tax=Neolewinella litorea TaxID=2562452 RepID=A0A4V3XLM4_9BACT|nr:glycosyltransferase family 2 protein [Neolewinella litorea]THH41133.1 glycosyltransferase family 2 protein [Neolewinella litorea]